MNLTPAYKPVDQMPYCCVPACIFMILNRRKIPCSTQEEIGYDLGLIVPKEKAHLFAKVRTGKKPASGYGTRVGKKQYSLNNYFKKNKIKLKETYYYISDIPDPKEFIISNIKQNNDIVVCFHNKHLYGQGDWGHVSLIQSLENNTITLIDPSRDVPKKRKVKLQSLIDAMLYHGREKSGGFWLITAVA